MAAYDTKLASIAQERKIFVGGVPQDLSQDDLFAVFSAYGGVKRAWLQRCRATDDKSGSNVQNHRGFGFVIFHEARAIEELLGESASCFVPLRAGVQVEVKRAVGSSKMTNAPWTEPLARPPPPQDGRALRGRRHLEAPGAQLPRDVAWAGLDDDGAGYAPSMMPYHADVGLAGDWHWPRSDGYFGHAPRSGPASLGRIAVADAHRFFANPSGPPAPWKPAAVHPGLDRWNSSYMKDDSPSWEDGDLDVDLSHLIEEFEISENPQRQGWLPQ